MRSLTRCQRAQVPLLPPLTAAAQGRILSFGRRDDMHGTGTRCVSLLAVLRFSLPLHSRGTSCLAPHLYLNSSHAHLPSPSAANTLSRSRTTASRCRAVRRLHVTLA
ncbi:hypothetical protein PHLGIDRAFT_291803 [Phlebiopsis gigantea 11061_1 CR5-6]|uniref:Uncharacterized protein n=1 Tax=Phlebiopsis gigantea (strain 11061_1 CR5-6) TaxID=745531 RepID=A0A0C3NDB2_PHLG1|nr:hypothetical protein PHLGIDRAFT_291803 [Phlebiopsis gigantea 11061_1 CR5-6]